MNKEQKKAYDAVRYLANKEKMKAKTRAWQKDNPEKMKVILKKHYDNGGKEKILEWQRNNRDKVKNSKSRWREKNPLSSWISDRIAGWWSKDAKSNLTTEYLIELFNAQSGKCYYSNQDLSIDRGYGKVRPQTASLDRLIPSNGYVEGNVVWCTFFTNTMKGRLTEQEFYLLMKNILNNRGEL